MVGKPPSQGSGRHFSKPGGHSRWRTGNTSPFLTHQTQSKGRWINNQPCAFPRALNGGWGHSQWHSSDWTLGILAKCGWAEGVEFGWLQTIADHRENLCLKIPTWERDDVKQFLWLIIFTILFSDSIDFTHGWQWLYALASWSSMRMKIFRFFKSVNNNNNSSSSY